MRTKQQCIADAIARKIMANTTRRYPRLYADALEEVSHMSFSKEQHATGEPSNGAPSTRGESFREVIGKNMNADMAVGSQVTNVTAHKVDGSDAHAANRPADAVLPGQPAPRDGKPANPKVL